MYQTAEMKCTKCGNDKFQVKVLRGTERKVRIQELTLICTCGREVGLYAEEKFFITSRKSHTVNAMTLGGN